MNKTKKIILVTGGARSGKSTYAEKIAMNYGEPGELGKCEQGNIVYLATAVPVDGEMVQRIKDHQEDRPAGWVTLEESLKITHALSRLPQGTKAVLIDCITFWVSNHLMDKAGVEEPRGNKVKEIEVAIVEEARKLCGSLKELDCSAIIVSNEVGLGLVPEHVLSRIYRDALGRANQMLAEVSEEVIFMISGIPLKVKG